MLCGSPLSILKITAITQAAACRFDLGFGAARPDHRAGPSRMPPKGPAAGADATVLSAP